MAEIVLTNQNDNTYNDPGSSFTLTHSVSAGADFLLVLLGYENEDFETPTSVVWDAAGANEALTEIGSGHTTADDSTVHAFYLIAPTAGDSKLITVNLSGALTAAGASIVAFSLAGVDQSSPIRDEDGDAQQDTTSLSATVSAVSGDFLAWHCNLESTSDDFSYTGFTFTYTLTQDNVDSGTAPNFSSGYGEADASSETAGVTFPTNHASLQLVALVPAASSSSSSSSYSSSSSSSSSSYSSSSSSLSSSSSSSSTSTTPGTKVWGRQTGTEEDYQNTFANNWTTSGGWYPSGSGDSETLNTSAGECEQTSISNAHYLGTFEAIIFLDKYDTGVGPAPDIYYKTASTRTGLASAIWTLYDGVSFTSLGWVKLKCIHTCPCPKRITENLNQRITEGDVGTHDRIIIL